VWSGGIRQPPGSGLDRNINKELIKIENLVVFIFSVVLLSLILKFSMLVIVRIYAQRVQRVQPRAG
jgi:hypothetical protein